MGYNGESSLEWERKLGPDDLPKPMPDEDVIYERWVQKQIEEENDDEMES